MGRSKVKKKYCYTCGEPVIISEYVYAYNEDFGDALKEERRSCKNKRWFHYFWGSHPVIEEENRYNRLLM